MGAFLGGWVNSALLAGTALAAVPLVIHLLNRQRHKPIQWAAMRFVLAAYRKTRRRVELENLLLLLLRMTGIALLALAVARPFTGSKSPLAGLTESRRDVVLVLDGSASTGYRESVETVFERAVTRAREIVRGLESARGDRVRLILAGAYPRLLSWTTPDQALSMLDTLAMPTDEVLDLAGAMGEVLRFAREDAGGAQQSTLEVRLLTDMQRRAFTPQTNGIEAGDKRASARPTTASKAAVPADDTQARPALYEELDKLHELGLSVIVEDLGPSATQPANLGIAAVKPLGPILGPGLPCEISVDVLNHGPSARSGVRVSLEIDGEKRPNALIDIAARGRTQAVFAVAFKTAGEHVLEARLEGDRLALDDSRFEVVNVPPPVRVLLVNGAPGAVIDEDEVGYLKAVLEPPADDSLGALTQSAPFEPREVEPEALSAPDFALSEYDVIWLANVSSLPAGVVERLEHEVAAGAGLIVSLGAEVKTDSYNTRLFRADLSGLLPAELGRQIAVSSRRDNYYRVKSFDEDNPALSFFADERWKPLLTEVPIYAFQSARPCAGSRILAALDDEASSPLLVERAYDRGHVLLWTTTIDPAWTRLPESPRTLVPLVHELVRYATRREAAPRNVAIGEPLSAEVTIFPRSLQIVRPDGSRRALDGEPERAGDGRWRLPVVPGKENTDRAGLYRIEIEGTKTGVEFAVQMDPLEGDLERIAPDELKALHTAFAPLRSGDKAGGDDGAVQPQRGELWRPLAIACFIALVLESLWAAWLGQRRSVRK